MNQPAATCSETTRIINADISVLRVRTMADLTMSMTRTKITEYDIGRPDNDGPRGEHWRPISLSSKYCHLDDVMVNNIIFRIFAVFDVYA